MATVAFQIFSQLAGDWHFHRTLSTAGTVSGNSCFQLLAADCLHYKESGIFTANNQKTYQVHQEYGYSYDATGDKIAAYFMRSGKLDYLFHELNFAFDTDSGLLTATGSHVCGEDRYHVSYEFVQEGEFIITYRVAGPRKNYVSRTLFRKLVMPAKSGMT